MHHSLVKKIVFTTNQSLCLLFFTPLPICKPHCSKAPSSAINRLRLNNGLLHFEIQSRVIVGPPIVCLRNFPKLTNSVSVIYTLFYKNTENLVEARIFLRFFDLMLENILIVFLFLRPLELSKSQRLNKKLKRFLRVRGARKFLSFCQYECLKNQLQRNKKHNFALKIFKFEARKYSYFIPIFSKI